MSNATCSVGSHHYFVADVAQVEGAGTITVIYVCTNCGDSRAAQFEVTKAGAPMKMLTNVKEK